MKILDIVLLDLGKNIIVYFILGLLGIIVGVSSAVMLSKIIRKLFRGQDIDPAEFIAAIAYKIPIYKRQFITIEKKLSYEFVSRTCMSFKKEYVLKSIVNGLCSFTDKYVWSNPDEINHNISSLNPKHNIMVKNADHGWNVFTIVFNQPYKKDELFLTGIFLKNLNDSKKKSQLFLSCRIDNKTKFLELCVKFNENLKPINIMLYIYKDSEQLCEYKKFPLKYDNTKNQIFYKKKYPKYLERYKITWDFKNDDVIEI